MNITPSVRSITEYAMKLSEQDAQEAVTDPYSFGERLAEQLRAAGVVATNGNGHAKAATKPKPAARAEPKARAGQRKSPNLRAATRGQGAYAVVTCPVRGCGRKLASARLPLHLRTKHPDYQQPEPTAQTTAPAA